MTDSPSQNEAAPTPPSAEDKQCSPKRRIEWTREHRLAVWANVASFLSAGLATAAFVILALTLHATQDSLAAARRTVIEAHEQAVQARRQADIAEDQLIATMRPRLKLVAITGAYVSRAKGIDVAWFNFKPTYKNFGPLPAEDISFEPHVFVVGAGPSPKQTCKTGEGRTMGDLSTDVVFPQDEGGGVWTGKEVPLDDLKREAARVLAIQPSSPVYLGVVGCLLYRSGNSTDTYVTGFVADLHMTGPQQDIPGEYIPLYNVLVAGDGPVKAEMELNTLSAWAD